MGIKVMKFGGTSVATAEARMTSALRVISAKEQGFKPVVVVSAIGRRGAPYATDTLINLLREIDPFESNACVHHNMATAVRRTT
jgi:aspartate kinase